MSRKIKPENVGFMCCAALGIMFAIYILHTDPKPVDKDPTIPKNPTFSQDILPIFVDRCMSCHSTKWTDYQVVVDNISKIKYKVIDTKQMPPGGLSDKAYETIKIWVNNPIK